MPWKYITRPDCGRWGWSGAARPCLQKAYLSSSRIRRDKQLDAVKESGGLVGLNLVTPLARADGVESPDTPVDVYVRHVQYMVERMGVEHVAIGADYGAAWFPRDLPDVSSYPVLMDALRAAGFSEAELHLIGWQNWLRVLKATWRN